MTRALDFSPLAAPVTSAEARAWRKAAAADGRTWAKGSAGGAIALIIVPLIIAAVVFNTVWTSYPGTERRMSFGVIIGIAVAIVFIVLAGRELGLFGGRWKRWMRLDTFARANGFHFSPEAAGPDYPGSIFAIGSSRRTLECLRTTEGRYLDFGSYEYTTGSGKSRRTHRWGYMAMRLDRRLPHMLLDSTANNGLFGSNLPGVFDRRQVLSLEGDFDRYFRLYCPVQYERDALYVFTPDLMALLIDEAAPFDVEIVDDWLFVYAARGLDVADPAIVTRILRIVDTVGAKTLRQTARYADERVGDRTLNVVATGGRRLRRGTSLIAILFALGFVAFFAWSFLGPIFTR